MLAVEKTHHIKLQMFGSGLDLVQCALRREYTEMEFSYDFESSENPEDEEYVDSRDSEIMKAIESRMTAGDVLLIRRENKGWTQAELSARTGIAIPNISLMEAGKRPIGARTAKETALIFLMQMGSFRKK